MYRQDQNRCWTVPISRMSISFQHHSKRLLVPRLLPGLSYNCDEGYSFLNQKLFSRFKSYRSHFFDQYSPHRIRNETHRDPYRRRMLPFLPNPIL
jgi:hypothetical protein